MFKELPKGTTHWMCNAQLKRMSKKYLPGCCCCHPHWGCSSTGKEIKIEAYQTKVCGQMILTPSPDHNGGLWCAEKMPCKIHDPKLCKKCGKKLKPQIDPITKNKSEYLYRCSCWPKSMGTMAIG